MKRQPQRPPVGMQKPLPPSPPPPKRYPLLQDRFDKLQQTYDAQQDHLKMLKAENVRLHKCLTSILDNSADYGTVNIAAVREAFAEASRLTRRQSATPNEVE